MPPDGWGFYGYDLEGAWMAIRELRRRVDEMQTADEVAAAVAEALKREHSLGLSALQKAGAAMVGGLVAVGAVIQIVQAVH